MASLMAVLGLNNSSFLHKLDDSKKQAASAGQEIASSLGGAVTEKLTEFASIAFIEETIRGTVEWGEQVSILSERLGISTEAVQQWDYALKLNGSNIQAATGFFEKLATARQKALRGKDEQIQAFKDLGVSIEDLKGKRLEDVARQIAEVFESGDPQKLIASLKEVGGKGAGEMVAAFRDGLAGLLQEAPKVGDATIDSLREAAERSKAVWLEFQAGIAPLIAWLSNALTLVWRDSNRNVRALVGFLSGGIQGAKDLVKEYEDSLKEADAKAEERNKKRHTPLAAGGLDETETKEAAREEKRLAEEKLRLEEKLFSLGLKNALEALPKEEQINELHRRRVELANYVAKNWGRMTEQGRLKAQIDLEELTGEEDRAQRGLKPDKEKKEHFRTRDVNALQRIGAFSAGVPPGLEVQRRSERHLQNIDHGIKAILHRGGTRF